MKSIGTASRPRFPSRAVRYVKLSTVLLLSIWLLTLLIQSGLRGL